MMTGPVARKEWSVSEQIVAQRAKGLENCYFDPNRVGSGSAKLRVDYSFV